ncbi:hypothetical protein [Marinimicrobium sp.]|jgi:NAD-dependent SIR2 family protein deacetylase|nr:hypothetical protein [Marinimicrobium sp.]MAN51182.1 hypothetical protein [Marinimicrobium sp.]|tara:strand:+ start:129 stop:317 length:189 start_codon:yes stop_codon:yes gene_type:complete
MRCRNCHGEIPDSEVEAETSAEDEGLLEVTATCPCCQYAFLIQVDIYEMDTKPSQEDEYEDA